MIRKIIQWVKSKWYILAYLHLASAGTGFGQSYSGNDNYAPPSPTAMGFVSQANNAVNLYTGSVNVNLPVLEIPGKDLSVPVSLSYSTLGIRVQDVPGWTGIGWTLNAGGMITRIVRGLPDELANGFCGVNNIGEKTEDAPTVDYIQNVSNRIWDSEPDQFYFNFPGKSGKFVLDANGSPVLQNYINVKITPGICNTGNGVWSIVDESGISYEFGTIYSAIESSNYQSGSINMDFVSTWYLTRIVHPTSDEVIDFYYSSGTPFSYSYYVQEDILQVYNTDFYGGNPCMGNGVATGATSNKNIKMTISTAKYLSRIITSKADVTFTSNSVRDDVPGAKFLETITVRDKNLTQLYSILFKYDYFNADNCTTSLCKRLKLDEVMKVANQNAKERLYLFQYNTSINLPARDSHQIDHWGYFNANAYSSKIPAVNDQTSPCGGFHSGADRNAHILRSQANILLAVIEGSGGYTQYEYGPHEYNSNGATLIAGGARIKSIKSCAGSNCETTEYSYDNENGVSTGILNDLPYYHFRTGSSATLWVGGGVATINKIFLVRTSSSQVDLFDIIGSHISYSRILKKVSGQGYEVNLFTNKADHGDIPNSQQPYWVDGNNLTVGEVYSRLEFPFTPNTSKANERGLLYEKRIYNEDDELLYQENLDYDFSLPAVNQVKAIRVGLRGICSLCFGAQSPTSYRYEVGTYDIITRPIVLTKTTRILYDEADPGNDQKKIMSTTDYSYIPFETPGTTISWDLLPRVIITTLPEGDKLIVKNKFTNDYLPSTNSSTNPHPIRAFQIMHMDNTLIESTTSYLPLGGNQTYTISGELNEFDATWLPPIGSMPTDIYLKRRSKLVVGNGLTDFLFSKFSSDGLTFIPDTRYRMIYQVNSFNNSTGNIEQTTDTRGKIIAYEWDNNNNLKTRTENAGSYQHRTSYDHAPLVGVTKITDPNSIETSSEYNSFQRLKLTRDHSGNILTASSAHSQGRQLDLNLSYSGSQLTNKPISFTAGYVDETVTGATYDWKFGNGTTLTTTSGVASFTYTNAGTYQVEVTRNSPVYGISKATKRITIIGPPVATICANGPIQGDICRIYPIADVYGTCTTPGSTWWSSTSFTVTGSGGCNSSYTYSWEYALTSSPDQWVSFGTTATIYSPFWSNEVASAYVRCRITDACGNTSLPSGNINIYFFKSTCQ